MGLTEVEQKELAAFETRAAQLLDEIASAQSAVTQYQLDELEYIAGRSARIGFGSDEPKALSLEMYRLIAWTDHMDDPEVVSLFSAALRSRPLTPLH